MRVTVCQMHDQPTKMEEDWLDLVAHVREEHPDLVVLPEMPFVRWFAAEEQFDAAVWNAALAAHDLWIARLDELAPATVVCTRPQTRNGRRLNEGFTWNPDLGYTGVHHKYYLPEEEYFWESRWYTRNEKKFQPFEVAGERAGLMICTEMWFLEHARDLGQAGVNLLICPRGTLLGSTEKWVAGGITAAVVSGAWCLASNRGGLDQAGREWGGNGWIIEPEEGQVLARTSLENPIITMDLDMDVAKRAKSTYPRYVST